MRVVVSRVVRDARPARHLVLLLLPRLGRGPVVLQRAAAPVLFVAHGEASTTPSNDRPEAWSQMESDARATSLGLGWVRLSLGVLSSSRSAASHTLHSHQVHSVETKLGLYIVAAPPLVHRPPRCGQSCDVCTWPPRGVH